MPGHFAAIPDGPTMMTSAPTLEGDEAHESQSTVAARSCKLPSGHTLFRAGHVQKPFALHTQSLAAASPYFRALSSTASTLQSNGQLSHPASSNHQSISGPTSFPDIDEFTFPLFQAWLHGEQLAGPHDFHSMTHYLSLYVLAWRFQIEALKNQTVDLVRGYYDKADMTSPAFRLDYIYANTNAPNLMRDFLIHTAASRAMLSYSGVSATGISDSIKVCLKQGGDMAADYAAALIDLASHPDKDVRRGNPCDWHEHRISEKCRVSLEQCDK